MSGGFAAISRGSPRSTRWSRSWRRSPTRRCKARTDEFKKQVADGTSLDDILVPAFATVREAAKRTLGQRHFDVQLIGGMILHEGKIAEMKTGEGKTLVATLAGLSQRARPGAACTSSPSTTTSPSATPNGWARSTSSSA